MIKLFSSDTPTEHSNLRLEFLIQADQMTVIKDQRKQRDALSTALMAL